MTNLRKGAAVAVAILALLSLAGAARAQGYYSPYRYADVVPGHHFYQTGGYVAVPPLPMPVPVGGYTGSVSGIPGSYAGSVFGLSNAYPLGVYGTYPFGLYNAYTFSLYNLSGYGLGNYVTPLGSYAQPYTLPPSNYAPVYQDPGYYTSPLLYQP